ncbi:YidH family protein [Parasphingorhabdus pacifica]
MDPHEGELPYRRSPRRLYGVGSEPDPRFSLANERTFLAWIRTALALMAAGVAVDAFALVSGSAPQPWGTALAFALLLAGILVSATAVRRWFVTERALRTGQALPSPRLVPVLGYGLAVAGAVGCFLLIAAWR